MKNNVRISSIYLAYIRQTELSKYYWYEILDYDSSPFREHSFFRKGGGSEESRDRSLNFYMAKKGGSPHFFTMQKDGGQEISARLLR